MIVAISTDIPSDTLLEFLEARLARIRSGIAPKIGTDLKTRPEKEGFISYDRNQSFIYLGYPMNHLQPGDVPYIMLLNEIMGANVGSRLWYLRQKEKLAYAVYTQYILNKHNAVFRAAIGTDTSKAQTALASLNREMKQLYDSGITEDELADAKANMKNSLIYAIDKKSNRAYYMAYYEYIGYGYRFVYDLIDGADEASVTGMNEFIKANLSHEKQYLAIVGKK
jgi:predicted Zn-dependent peptidase